MNGPCGPGHDHLIPGLKYLPLARGIQALSGHIVDAQHDVLGGHNDGLSMRWGEHIVCTHHEYPGLGLGLYRKRHVYCHLVAVKVCVVGHTDQWVQLDGLALYEHWLKGLDTQPVEGGGAVKHDGIFAHHLVQCIPHLRDLLFHQLLGALYGGDKALFLELVVDEGLK